jgi:hypothetical protein
MIRFLRSLWFFLTALPSLARLQLLTWPQRTHWLLRCAMVLGAARWAKEIGDAFAQLPDGWPGAVVAHLFTGPGVFVAIMLLTFATAGIGLSAFSIKVGKTL